MPCWLGNYITAIFIIPPKTALKTTNVIADTVWTSQMFVLFSKHAFFSNASNHKELVVIFKTGLLKSSALFQELMVLSFIILNND